MAQIHITDASTIALVERISLIEGKPPETIVQEAVQEKAERDGVEHPTPGLAARLIQIGRETAPLWDTPHLAYTHGDLLYDDDGLPK